MTSTRERTCADCGVVWTVDTLLPRHLQPLCPDCRPSWRQLTFEREANR